MNIPKSKNKHQQHSIIVLIDEKNKILFYAFYVHTILLLLIFT